MSDFFLLWNFLQKRQKSSADFPESCLCQIQGLSLQKISDGLYQPKQILLVQKFRIDASLQAQQMRKLFRVQYISFSFRKIFLNIVAHSVNESI